MMPIDRRNFVAALTTGVAGSWIAAHLPDLRATAAYAAQVPEHEAYQALTPAQAKELDAITATFVPTDDTPGAREARVVRFVDRSLATWAKDQVKPIEASLKEVAEAVAAKKPSETSFANLTAADQIAVLEDLQKNKKRAYFMLRRVTMIGMFSNPEHGGNANKVGWKLIGFDDRFSWVPPFGYYDRA